LAVTLLNIHESARFKKGAFRFWGCLPVYSAEAAQNAGVSETRVKHRIAEVHQLGLHIVLDAIRELNAPAAYRFANGQVLMGEARLAFIMGDQPAQDKHIGKNSKSCRTCLCPSDKLASTDETFAPFSWRACHKSLLRTADECLDDDGKVLYGKKKVIESWEQKSGLHFMHNSLFEMADDVGLLPVIGLPRDFLHWILLGLFGYHIVKAIIYLLSMTIVAPAYLTEHGNRKAPVNQSTSSHILRRLARRLSRITADESCLTISEKFAQHFLKVYEQGKSKFTGARMIYLMLVLPYVLVDLVGKERRTINAAIDIAVQGDPLHGLPHVEDPCEAIIDALLVFLKWFMLVRKMEHRESEIAELTTRGIAMMEKLKEVFPEKSGEAQAWNFRKFHDIVHTPIAIMFFGWIETTSCQSGELAHKLLLKALAENLNNSNVFLQFLRYWERIEQLMRAQREHSEAVGESVGADVDPDNEDVNVEDSRGTKDDRTRSEAMHGCELGPRCPLIFMALNRSSLHHTAASTGGDSRGLIKGKRAFNVWRLPAADLASHPVLSDLGKELAKYAVTYLSGTLNIPQSRDQHGIPSVEELNHVLLEHLVERKGHHVRVWCTLEIESGLCAGVQRIRCNPFKTRKDMTYGRNFSQYVTAIPPKKYTGISFRRFNVADVEHRQKLWFGRVELFFRCSFKSSGGRVFDVDLALISFLYDFKCPAAMTILQREAGARMFYEPDRPWLIVLPINHILGRVPLMKVYLEGSDSPTIPSSLARFKQPYFRHGHADRASSSKGTGSRLFMLNVHMWQYGRPQPRTISVEERHAKLAKARQVSGQKRERRKALLQDRSACRRASLQVSP
jgi:hypothetical protein